jgi:divalent metal cation (Fe/Co/Zn/Cd) transporter
MAITRLHALRARRSSCIAQQTAIPASASCRSVPTSAATPGVDRIIHLRTLHLGPDQLLIAAKVGIRPDDDGADISATIDAAEARIRQAVPAAQVIYLEPDIYRPQVPAT